jgi:hypothetical protein
MFVNDSSQSINHLPTSKTVSTSASQGNLQERKVKHLPKDNIKSGSQADKNGAAALFLFPFAIILVICGLFELTLSAGQSHKCFDIVGELYKNLN